MKDEFGRKVGMAMECYIYPGHLARMTKAAHRATRRYTHLVGLLTWLHLPVPGWLLGRIERARDDARYLRAIWEEGRYAR